MIELTSASVERTMAIGRTIAAATRSRDIIALDGELGAGKTQFVRGLADGLGLDPAAVSSPTFVLMHEYEQEDGSGLVLVHIDAYRLSHPRELDGLGWGDELLDGAVVAIEWAPRVLSVLSEDRLDVHLAHAPGGRTLRLDGRGTWAPRLHELAKQLETS